MMLRQSVIDFRNLAAAEEESADPMSDKNLKYQFVSLKKLFDLTKGI